MIYNKIITCGPFVGSFFEEIMYFRPFVNWIHENLLYDDLYIFSHYNRSFMYNTQFIPIYDQYSIDDTKYKNHLNKDISTSLFNQLWKSLRQDVISTTGYQLKDIISLYNKYQKNRIKILNVNKSFNKIKTNINLDINDYIVFIPDKRVPKKNLKIILNHLQSKYKLIILGDSNIYFQELNYIDSYTKKLNTYQYIIEVINKAKLVIAPLSGWTFLCNLQNIPVFSWGKDINISPYKKNGFYNFNNNSYIITNVDIKNIITSIDRFIKIIQN